MGHTTQSVYRAIARASLLIWLGGVTALASLPAAAVEVLQRQPGKFAWFDLITSDLTGAQKFYGNVFGWEFRKVGKAPGSYTYVELEGARIGGLLYRAPPEGARRNARWLSLVSVNDARKAARDAEALGGAVLVAPAEVKGRGTHALLRDPQGAVFGVLQPEKGDRPDTPVESGDFFWVDLLTRDPGAAAQFYSGLAEYEVSDGNDSATPRLVLSSQGYARAGIIPLPEQVKQPGWLPYVLVDDVPATLARVQQAGGTVLVQPRSDVLDGNLAVISDPSGGVLGIVNWVGPQEREQ
jgi:predicted enzyme related to lactoylglutathione lyase